MLIPKIYSFTTDFLVVKSSDTLKTVKTLVLRTNPKYLVIARDINNTKYRYALLKDAFITGVEKYAPSDKDTLEKILDLNENNFAVTLKAFPGTEKDNEVYVTDDIDRAKESLQSKAGGNFIIIERDNDALGLVDLSTSQYRIPFYINGINEIYRYPPPPATRGVAEPKSKTPTLTTRSISEYRTIAKPVTTSASASKGEDLEKAETSPTIKRYPEASFPIKVKVGTIYPLEVYIKTQISNPLIQPMNIPVSPADREKENVIINVAVTANGFEVIGDSILQINVPVKDEDSDPVMFQLKPVEEGLQTIMLKFFKSGNFLGIVKLSPFVEKMASEPSPSKMQTATGNSMSEPSVGADFTLIIDEISVKENDYNYKISIYSNNIPYKEMGPLHLTYNPEQKFRNIFEDIEKFGSQPNMIDDSIKNKGLGLYDELFPDDLKSLYWKIRDSIKNIQVVSAEPWIPWEIIKPQRRLDDGKIEEDQFLCERFSFARWLQKDFVTKDKINTVKTLVPDDINLESAKSEREWIENFGKEKGFDVSNDSSYEDIMSTLKNGGFDLLHVSTHGIFEPNVPTFSGIQLEGGNQLRVENINGVATYFGKDHPMVVFSACQTGMQGFSLTRVQSWATRFLEAGASIFIGTLWSVKDSTATEFAVALYERLSTGNITIGEAVRQARIVCKRTGDPSWLAFELYGNPTIQIMLGSK
jgi:hypothetical protein